MKKLFTLLGSIFLISSIGNAQLNVSYISQVSYEPSLNDIWGYVAPDGTEYAIVGLTNGTSIVSLADPENPLEVAFVGGDNSTWRDIKTWGEFAYVTTDTGDDGLTVIDLSGLPDAVSTTYLTSLPDVVGNLRTCHNIYIDSLGFAYLAGCNLNSGGLIFIDVATTPGVPELAGLGAPVYSHDVYARDNKAYSAEINLGRFGIYDVTDKANPVLLGAQNTAANFTHNSWLSDDGSVLFTTDETGNAPVGAYDVSDPADIQELDQFRPLETLGDGVIPHNVHVWDDYLIISYYTDGCIIVDASRPGNLVEIGNFDTFIPASTGFSGAWGAYPYLPSGLILVSDINTGLYILEPDYVRACWLEGQITELSTGNALSGAAIEILNTNVVENSDVQGNYATGFAVPESYEVEVSKPGYISVMSTVELVNGEITILDVALDNAPSISMTGILTDAITGDPIANGVVTLFNDDFDINLSTDASGNFSLATFFAGDYDIAAGKWGYKTVLAAENLNENNNFIELALEPGIEDIFSVDLGWSVTGNAQAGEWERVEPQGIYFELAGFFLTPDEDSNDLGSHCYVTENNLSFNGSVAGNTTVTSPVFDLTDYETPHLAFNTWMFSVNPNTYGAGDDEIEVTISNGTDEEVIAIIESADLFTAPEWVAHDLNVDNMIPLTNNMQVSFRISNVNSDFTECGLDFFQVYDAGPMEAVDDPGIKMSLKASPNPSPGPFSISYQLGQEVKSGELVVTNLLGRVVAQQTLEQKSGKLEIGRSFSPGVYLVQIKNGDAYSKCLKLVKIQP